MGTPEFAVGPLSMLIENKYEIAAVVTVPDKPSGRGLKVNESDVKKYAVSQNIPVMQPVSLKDPEFLAQLKAIDADLFIVVAFRMLPKEVWSMPRMGTFNLHASLLPRYRGAAPINWAIINGEKVTGVTTFLIDEQIDTGRILFQTQCPIDNYETAGSLHDKLMALGSELVVKTTEAFVNHNVKSYLQENFAAVKPAPKITREICHIDWTQNARDVDALIRGLSPYPAAYTSIVSGEEVSNVKIYDSYVVESIDNDLPAGTITTDGKTFIEVKCGSRSIRIENIQVAGKKRLFTKDFLLGFRDLEKYKFV
ncbi:MAG: methionyl-tRNA formyltransferase [Bacteroidales bacterium]|nr:methionyl-tRNA formyltransferase [Bacteroidales bacterium]MDD3200814.1 methionyl-tRNA formyltransferase [Bacteroidales bacterium]